MVVNNPNNWHWVDKNVFPWSKAYITETLSTVEYSYQESENKDVIVKVSDVVSITGDSDLSQRKGKAIVIYDMKIEFEVEGVAGAQTGLEDQSTLFKSLVEIPEFIHDMDNDDYQFIIKEKSLDLDTKKRLQKDFFPLLVKQLQQYQPRVLDVHAKDLKHKV